MTSMHWSRAGLLRFVKRYSAKAAIIAAGAAIAVGSLERPGIIPTLDGEKPFAQVVSGSSHSVTKPLAILDWGDDHSKIGQWIARLTSPAQRPGVEKTLAKKSHYEEMIRAKLDERDMPGDLIYLAGIESNFNPRATSHVRARGLWQFMSSTARQLGLAVSRRTDERTDPEKATDAALTYLQQLKDRFGSWYLAAAAYNSGPGTVSKALKKTTGRTSGTDADFWRISAKLPRETREYVPKLIAMARIGNDPAKYGLKVDTTR